IDVEFDFFDPNPNVDYHAIKRLLIQLFGRDSDIFSLHELTELLLAQPLGTTIKTDGTESDPYAILSLINMHAYHEHPSIKALAAYFLCKAAQANPTMHTALQTLFSQSQPHVGLVICERLINMPVQVIPPMYRLLLDELQNALSADKPYKFSHILFLSRTYHLSNDEESALANSISPRQANGKSNNKKSKKAKTADMAGAGIAEEYNLLTRRPSDGIYPFHPEDLVIMQMAECTMDYKFDKAPAEPREKDAFGLDVRGRAILVRAD
ncbi:hypothetical protein AMATHDRAFT_92948, partial [Amanita thiersii Skay4041]